jgi:DNA excision repair protein ERCC-2
VLFAGRLIGGVLYLIDDRLARAEVRGLLPAWWQVEIVRHAAATTPAARPSALR